MDPQDDTFSDLVLRPKLDSSGGSASHKQNVLPQPDEVIAIPTDMMSNKCMVEDASRVPRDGEEDPEEGQALLQPDEDDVVDATCR